MRYRVVLLPLLLFALHSLAAPGPLFDGQTLDGWEGDAKWWRVEDGALTGGSRTEKVPRNFFLATKRTFHNFDLRLKLKLTGDPKTGMINSGVQIRSLRVPNNTEMSGYQIDAGEGWWGKLYDESRRNKVLQDASRAVIGAVKKDDWNEYRIRAEGPKIHTWINGVLALTFEEDDVNIAQDGHIAVQIHSGGHAVVQVKDVMIEELPPTPNAPTWEKLGGIEAARTKVQPPKKDAATKPLKEGTAPISAAKTPKEQLTTFKLPEGFEIQLVAAEDPANGIGKFVPIAFDQRGALWTTTALEYPVDGNENPAAADALYASQAKDKVLVYDRDPKSSTGYSAKPRVFAEGLAIPLGVLPYKNGCYVQHGHDIAFLEDTDADGRADKRTVILTGFGVQDSHLFPHQFLRAPGGWIWMAQGAFNYGKVRRPDEPPEEAVQFDQTRMAKFHPDGSGFEITSNGPCNIWGLVLNGEGEAFIQEANDFGYPVMPFHEYANYPGCSDRQWKSYAPEFPGTADFKVGGTGLSGLALLDEGWARLLARGAPLNRHPERSFRGAEAGGNAVEVPLTLTGEGGALNANSISPAASALGKVGGPSTPLRSAQDDSASSQTMLIANPITNRINAIRMHRRGGGGDKGGTEDGRAGPRWRLEQMPDFVESSDPWFRPVAISVGPDGCLYIVDWYNKIISHNEVPRNHPDRDKTRGRIWRVKAKAVKPFDVPDFTKLSGDELIAKLGGDSLAQSHLAWQTLDDRRPVHSDGPTFEKLIAIVKDRAQSPSRRVQALWASGYDNVLTYEDSVTLSRDVNSAVRREAIPALSSNYSAYELATGLGHLVDDPEPTVRVELLKMLGRRFFEEGGLITLIRLGETPSPIPPEEIHRQYRALRTLLTFAKPPLDAPLAPSTRNGKAIKVREAYDREFERYLVRMFLEEHPKAVAWYLDSGAAESLPVEARLLAALALEPLASAARVAKLLPQLQRAPGQEEVLRLAQFLDEPGVGEALRSVLANPKTSVAALDALLAVKTRLDARKLEPFLTDAAKTLIASADAVDRKRAFQLISAFQLSQLEEAVAMPLIPRQSRVFHREPVEKDRTGELSLRLSVLRDLRSCEAQLFYVLAESDPDELVREAALGALIASSTCTPKSAGERLFALYPKLRPEQRKAVLSALSGQAEGGAKAVVAALDAGTIAKTDLDSAMLDRLQAVLGPNDPALTKLMDRLGALFHPVLALDGSDAAWTQTNVTLDGPCTMEAWARLDPQGRKIGNNDSIAGAPGQLDFNFFGERARIYAFPPLGDVAIAKKPLMPGLWTHVAATRDAAGIWKLYLDGELDSTGNKPAPGKIENVRLAWNGAKGGTQGALSEVRLWNRERTADEIRAASDRSLPANTSGLVFTSATGDWGKLQSGAKIIKTSDFPPILTTDGAALLDAKYEKFRALAGKPGDAEKGKVAAALCQACHLMGPTGGNIGPNLSGVGAMGTEAILRHILQPNAAMENGYRIYRLELRNGDLVDALFVNEDKDAVIVRLPGSDDRRIPRAEIRDTKYLRRSLMPEALLDTMTPEQVSDLFAYLKTLK